MSAVAIRMTLTEGRTGHTCILGKYQFVKGQTIVRADEASIGGLVKYLGRCYKAYPEGSEELVRQQAIDRGVGNGKSDVEESREQGESTEVSGDLLTGVQGSEEIPSDNGGGAAGDQGGDAGIRTNGNGREDTRIITALSSLDGALDEHWTADGRPRVDVVASMSNVPGLTRAHMDSISPGFIRPTK